jgi:hypothetical protein
MAMSLAGWPKVFSCTAWSFSTMSPVGAGFHPGWLPECSTSNLAKRKIVDTMRAAAHLLLSKTLHCADKPNLLCIQIIDGYQILIPPAFVVDACD